MGLCTQVLGFMFTVSTLVHNSGQHDLEEIKGKQPQPEMSIGLGICSFQAEVLSNEHSVTWDKFFLSIIIC